MSIEDTLRAIVREEIHRAIGNMHRGLSQEIQEALQETVPAPTRRDILLSVDDAAAESLRAPETIRRMARSGELHGTQRSKSGTWFFRLSCIEAWIEGCPCEHRRAISPDARRKLG